MLKFACLLFGLATALRVFTKLMKPVVANGHVETERGGGGGMRLIILSLFDNILIIAESEGLVLHWAASTLNLLEI
jgi:hypothetical protein